MADKESAEGTWPTVKFSFRVKFGEAAFIFQEVTGLSSETQIIEYRSENSKVDATVKMPGIQKYGNVTLKKGLFKGDNALWAEFNSLKMNAVKRTMVRIDLLDEAQGVAMSWTLANAFPAKVTVSDMKSDANEIAVESIELAHEGLEINKS
jgi:phage tail-like protein